jgi:hypothetical protein
MELADAAGRLRDLAVVELLAAFAPAVDAA